jgi:asparagine synthase (glutamine-hydrolysing)
MLTRLPGDFLYKVDTASMHNSLEVRAPFLDHRLVDFSFETQVSTLMPNEIDKEITRSIYKDFYGRDHEGPKKGFSIPYMLYLKGDWGIILENFLKEGLSKDYFHFNTKGLLKLLYELRNTDRQSSAKILFSTLVMEIWLRVFHLDQELELSFSKK